MHRSNRSGNPTAPWSITKYKCSVFQEVSNTFYWIWWLLPVQKVSQSLLLLWQKLQKAWWSPPYFEIYFSRLWELVGYKLYQVKRAREGKVYCTYPVIVSDSLMLILLIFYVLSFLTFFIQDYISLTLKVKWPNKVLFGLPVKTWVGRAPFSFKYSFRMLLKHLAQIIDSIEKIKSVNSIAI